MSQARFVSLRYIVFISLLIGACASFSATSRITPSLMLSLAVVWAWVPLLHVLVARLVAGRQGDLLLAAHAPWSLWLIAAAIMTGTFGYAAYWWMLLLAIVPALVTIGIVFTFCREVLGLGRPAAIRRTLLHQTITWATALIYLERAVSLIPRIRGVFS